MTLVRPFATRKARAAYIGRRLAELYPEPPVPLAHRDPFTLMVAVVLSARCTDRRVNEITPRLFALADAPEAMARLQAEVDAFPDAGTLSYQQSESFKYTQAVLQEALSGKSAGTP